MNIKIESQSTFERCLQEGINIFTGAGFSVLAKDKTDAKLPVGDGLRQELLAAFPSAPKKLALPQLCTFISRCQKDNLNAYIKNRFDVGQFDERYENLNHIEIKSIFTTNVDNLLEKIFQGSSKKYVNNTSFNGAEIKDRSAIDYVHLHGCVLDSDSPMIFGDLDIASALSSDPHRWSYLRSQMNKHPTLFWGYSLKDAGTLETFADALDDNNKKKSWIILHPDYTSEDDIEYFKALDLKIIISDTGDFLDYLSTFKSKALPTYGRHTNPLPEFGIPTHSDVQHRAIQDFYEGGTPEWSDIYSSRVCRLRFYDLIEEQINRGRNILITGGPATGKTTLLMQVAAFHDFNGVKIILSEVSLEKAQFISNKLADTSCLLFVDNLQTSIEALNYLSKKPNIQLVIAERDYAYLSASRANFLRRNIDTFDITPLNDMDAQSVINSIPADIKKREPQNLSEGDSLFELIEKNCTGASIKQRFNNVIEDLKKKDDDLVQLFLLACYLHTCRSITSMDVLYSYFSRSYGDYKDLYKLIEILSSSLSEHAGEFAKQEQDYFSIRSNLLADYISEIAPTNDLAKMLTRFHDNVSRFCIPNFDSFKRRGYDAKLFQRAFSKIEDGVKVYDKIYQKHSSPFNLQQKALYLSRMNEHEKAFEVIDDAIAKGGSRNWSIKNSYAIIKFRANIERDRSMSVIKALNESMDALEQCHSADIRKAFHAMTYADHAMRYWKKYRDETATSYLKKASHWLMEESETDNKISNVVKLLKQVNMALAQSS